MSRLGWAGRLILYLAIAFLAVQALMSLAYLSERRAAGGAEVETWTPFPDQLAALAEVFDRATPEEREVLVRAMSDARMGLTLSDLPPLSEAGRPDLVMPGLSSRLRSYAEALQGRPLQVAIPAESAEGRMPRLRGWVNPERLRITMGLADGTFLIVEPRRVEGLAVMGLPVGLFTGLISSVFAMAVVLLVWREAGPLRRLGEAAQRFGQTLAPVPVPPKGAPDLRRLAEAFNAMQDSVARMDRSRSDMIAALAHDIRTPLTRLRLRLRGLGDRLQAEVDRDIADIARIGEDALRFAAADLAALDDLVALAPLVAAVADRPGCTFRDSCAESPVVPGNAELLRRAVENLIANALAYGTRCRVTLSCDRQGARIEVEDDGPGIPPGDRARMIEPFQRGEASRNRTTGGAGLGLALVQRIAQRHGARLELGESPLGGLSARLVFPPA